MSIYDTIELLSFNLKLISKKSKKNVLVSAGTLEDKEKILPAIKLLAGLEKIVLYATQGTSEFLQTHGIKNHIIYKIASKQEPNIESFLSQNRFDFAINILSDEHNHDEMHDSKLIRKLVIESGIPLITDVDVATVLINQIVQEQKKGVYQYKIADKSEPWNMQLEFFQLVSDLGGFANYHAHFDKAYLISMENLKLGQVDMQKKWELYKYLKESYTHDDLIERISRGLQKMVDQGVTYCRTALDADSTVKLLPIKAALEVKERFKDKIHFEVATQPLQGVLEAESRKYFIEACEMADVVGGLPSKDRPTPEKHIDFILQLAKDLGKPVDIHIDQENNPQENETEMLARKVIEHGMEGKVFGIHAVSISAKKESEQKEILKLVKDAGLNIIVCPSAAISMKPLPMNTPIHNSIVPVPKLLEYGIPVYLGVDNIYDLFMPLVDGDMWFECRMLMESCRFYDIEKVAQIACDKGGTARKFHHL